MRLTVKSLPVPLRTREVLMFVRFTAIGFLVILLLSGCAETRLQTVDDSIVQQQLALLEDGKTTKQDILLKFGIPSAQFEGEKIFTYRLRYNQKENRFEVVSREVDRRDPRFAEWMQTEYNLVLVFDEKHVLQKYSMLRINP
jgi:outer membrane protein assembly factor BamE (lipoprotein component of BamABCDE complex)